MPSYAPPEIHSHTFESRRHPGHWLHLSECGQQNTRTALLVHGAAGNWRNFLHQMPALAQTHHVIAVDLRGHGRSPWPEEPSTIEDFYSDIEELLDFLPERFDLIAHSFGGYLATRLAAEHGTRVRSLTLINTAYTIPQGLCYRLLQFVSPGADLIAAPEGMIAARAEVCRQLLDHVMHDWDCRPYYPRLNLPAMLILGALDPLIPLAAGRETAEFLPRCKLHMLPFGGHVSMWEAPERVNGWLMEFLDGNSGLP
jgi:3-oxoadipate enol-lactonase/4-carboxymuconolactone decarboxylase